jgi:hypothetical protein
MSIAKQVFDGPPGDIAPRLSSFLLISVGYHRQGCACVGLGRLQKTLFAGARDAPVGHQVEVLTLRLNRGEPHPLTASDAGHIDGGLKTRTGRRWSGCLQHGILEFPKRRRNAIQWINKSASTYVRFPTKLERASASPERKDWLFEALRSFAIEMTIRFTTKTPRGRWISCRDRPRPCVPKGQFKQFGNGRGLG